MVNGAVELPHVASYTVTLIGKEPGAVGVPLMAPPLENESPGGRLPDIDQFGDKQFVLLQVAENVQL
jgi:hypothetical protein